MHRLLLLGLLGCTACSGTSAVGGAAPASTADAEEEWVFTAPLAVPNHIAGFSVSETEEYEDPSHGIRMRFVGPLPVRIDAFLYPILPAAFATSDAGRDTAAAREFERAYEDIVSSLARRGEAAPVRLSERTLQWSAGEQRIAQGHRVSVSYRRDGIDWYSHLYVIAAHDRYVKVRASYSQTEGTPEPPAALDAFVQALFAEVIAGYGKEGDTGGAASGQ